MTHADETRIRQSLLWSLIDEDPERASEELPSPRRQLERIRESVRQDLQNLLNTRQRCRSCPPELEELRRSVFEYGIVDLSGANLASTERRESFLAEMRTVIAAMDPRLVDVRVHSLDNSDSEDRTLRFRIQATLRIEDDAETTSFDFRMEPVSRRIG